MASILLREAAAKESPDMAIAHIKLISKSLPKDEALRRELGDAARELIMALNAPDDRVRDILDIVELFFLAAARFENLCTF